MVEIAIDFFFSMINWSFDFLLQVKILKIPVLYYLFSIMILGFVIVALINVPNAGNSIIKSSRSKRKEKNN